MKLGVCSGSLELQGFFNPLQIPICVLFLELDKGTLHFVFRAATNYLRNLCGASVIPSKEQNQIWDYREFLCFQCEFFAEKWRTESQELSQSCLCTQTAAQAANNPRPMGCHTGAGRRVWEQGWCLIIQLDNGVGVGPAGVSLPNNSPFLQFVIIVVDSTDRERISVTKEELYKMLAHEDLKKAGLLIFANKQDVKECMTVAEISQFLKLTSIKDHQWHIQACCALTGEGLCQGLEWMMSRLKIR
uniref:ARF like GTPase 5A n=3 Tax=Passeriformes TaxID=9126 RepID=A0A8C3EW94_CORMO